MRHTIFIILTTISLLFINSCTNNAKYEECGQEGWHRISFPEFSIVTPTHVRYIPQTGDHFQGDLVGDALNLTFEYRKFPDKYSFYSDPLVPTPEEYVQSQEWLRLVISMVYMQMREKDPLFEYPSENQFSILNIQPDTTSEWKYIVNLKFKDSVLHQSFEYPRELQKYEFETDTIDNKYIKLVYPMVSHKGQMGIHIASLHKPEEKNYSQLTVMYVTEEISDEHKLEILRSVKMK